jgi:hypothetical protein
LQDLTTSIKQPPRSIVIKGFIFKNYTKNEAKCWTEFQEYLRRRKCNKEDIVAIKDRNGRLITESIEKATLFTTAIPLPSAMNEAYSALTYATLSPLVLNSLGESSCW